jgi:hypothetical protein
MLRKLLGSRSGKNKIDRAVLTASASIESLENRLLYIIYEVGFDSGAGVDSTFETGEGSYQLYTVVGNSATPISWANLAGVPLDKDTGVRLVMSDLPEHNATQFGATAQFYSINPSADVYGEITTDGGTSASGILGTVDESPIGHWIVGDDDEIVDIVPSGLGVNEDWTLSTLVFECSVPDIEISLIQNGETIPSSGSGGAPVKFEVSATQALLNYNGTLNVNVSISADTVQTLTVTSGNTFNLSGGTLPLTIASGVGYGSAIISLESASSGPFYVDGTSQVVATIQPGPYKRDLLTNISVGHILDVNRNGPGTRLRYAGMTSVTLPQNGTVKAIDVANFANRDSLSVTISIPTNVILWKDASRTIQLAGFGSGFPSDPDVYSYTWTSNFPTTVYLEGVASSGSGSVAVTLDITDSKYGIVSYWQAVLDCTIP